MSQYALDWKGRWKNAVETPRERGVTYTCDCPDRHIMKLVKPLGLGKREFRDYFAHISTHNTDGSGEMSCRGGGESEVR
jgi:hypothetical protein